MTERYDPLFHGGRSVCPACGGVLCVPTGDDLTGDRVVLTCRECGASYDAPRRLKVTPGAKTTRDAEWPHGPDLATCVPAAL